MGILDNGPHNVIVQLRKNEPDPVRGKLVLTATGEPIPMKGVSVQPLSSEDRIALGGAVKTTDTVSKITSRTWPGAALSLVIYDGYEWDTIGDPLHMGMSPRTEHWETRIVRGARLG
ncbi:hypothetical protein [Glaciihabitans sp. dw_435]|uniref:hypothetical protein n=1 Tax=Glaciihabitans sp. dw_435 TaxID=2720081 RepID=UPI001BD4BFF8|nr:hypothetical protein [Glaciihabitans sp. dw_435]